MSKVLIVDDEPTILSALNTALESDGHQVVTADSAADAETQATAHHPDLVILDLGLPDSDGITLTRSLRRWFTAPILILSGANEESSKIEALDAGADDYLQKPFGVGELRARIRALQRRAGEPPSTQENFGALAIDREAGSIHVDNLEVRLTRTEWMLVELFSAHPGKLMTHARVAESVWGQGYGDEMRQSLRGHVKSLRAKIGDDANEPRYLRTESGAGYRWIAEPRGGVSGSTFAEAGSAAAAPDTSTTDPPTDLATLVHDLNNALTVVAFALDSAIEIAQRDLPADNGEELLNKLHKATDSTSAARDLTVRISRAGSET